MRSKALYPDAFLNKGIILKDNKNKGVYRWVNKVNGSSYIGSSVNLDQRLRGYFSFSFITRSLAKGKSLIYSAILKHGYSNFQLEILEYCDPENAISREQYYMDLLKPVACVIILTLPQVQDLEVLIRKKAG